MSEFAKMIEELMKMPDGLCRMCGRCCRLSIFKGGLSFNEVKAVAEGSPDAAQKKGAADFLSVFVPYNSVEDARAVSAKFVEDALAVSGRPENQVTFFHCRFVGADNKCSIHDKRPDLCKKYPTIHERTLYFEGCGYEVLGKENWRKISYILDFLNKKQKNIDEKRNELQTSGNQEQPEPPEN